MEACHVLLEIPWQFDKHTIHDGLTNEITFTHNNKKFVLHPLTPTQVLKDQVQEIIILVLKKHPGCGSLVLLPTRLLKRSLY